MSLKGMRVLVTGAGGFIGSHLAEALVAEGARVRALVRYNGRGERGWLDQSPSLGEMDVVAGDITDYDSVEQAMRDCECVFHLAALIAIPYSYIAPQSFTRTNVDGTMNVMRVARARRDVRVVHTSTSEVYGTACYVPIDEKHPLQPQSPYSASKIAADMMALSFHNSFGVPAVVVRPFNTYGPRQSLRAIIPSIVLQCLRGDRIQLGKISPRRDLTFVADTARGFITVGTSDAAVGRVVNLGTGREISIENLAHLIARRLGRNITIESEERRLRPENSEVERLMADASAAAEIGWKPSVALEEGLDQTIEWVRQRQHLYDAETYQL